MLICGRASTLEMLTNSVPDNLGHSECIFESRPKDTFPTYPFLIQFGANFMPFDAKLNVFVGV